ncbi:MAG: HEAT repeat domain-containing protein [Myxococcaceae bacterium]|nr:HEAT repeat domain-containing protein [Myxococcaceae bacterium]
MLVGRVGDEDPDVRIEATGQLADLVRPDARGAFAPALEDAEPLVRFEAARGMAALKHPAGMVVLVAALDDRGLRYRALGALGELGDARALPAVQRLFRRWFLPVFEKTQAAGVLARLGDTEGGAYLLSRLGRRWTPDRAMAAELRGETRVSGARERLLELLKDRAEPARGAAARGLGRTEDPELIAPLTALLEEPGAPEDLRLDAAEGLCFLQTEEAHARVRAALASFGADGRAEVEALLAAFPVRAEVKA